MSFTFDFPRFIRITLVVSLWIHLSEGVRFFGLVVPTMRQFLSGVPNFMPMDFGRLLLWAAWDMLLTGLVVFVFWLYAQHFGNTLRSVLTAATLSWAFFFVLFWVAMVLMGLATLEMILWILPWTWLEMALASGLAAWLYQDKRIPAVPQNLPTQR